MQCLGPECPTAETVARMDDEFSKWESSLQVPFRWRLSATPEDLQTWCTIVQDPKIFNTQHQGMEPDPSAASNEFTILRQRHTLATWFLACRIMLHRQFMVPYNRNGGLCARNIQNQAHSQVDSSSRDYHLQSERLCFDLCFELCTVQVAGHGVDSSLNNGSETTNSRKVYHGKISGFMDSFFLFDCAVGLMLCLCSFAPGDPRSRIAYDAVERAGNILARLAKTTPNDPQGDISRRAIAVLLVLKRYQEQIMQGVGSSLRSTAQNGGGGSSSNNRMQVDSSQRATASSSSQHHASGSGSNNRGGTSSSVSTPSSYERYSRYLDTAASPQVFSSGTTGLLDDVGSLPDFSFLNSFTFPEDPAIAIRQFSSPDFDWGADWSSISTAV